MPENNIEYQVEEVLRGTQKLLDVTEKEGTEKFLLALYAREKSGSTKHSWGYTKTLLRKWGITANDFTYRKRMIELEEKGFVKAVPIYPESDSKQKDYVLTEQGKDAAEKLFNALRLHLYAQREFYVLPPEQLVETKPQR